ncbi:Fe(3+) ions import ATP-binding protein FbpC [Synergistales bacterium]|nr:Fe(3+) ions import ATP-binding protein FbpC [Synergistales bacterium]
MKITIKNIVKEFESYGAEERRKQEKIFRAVDDVSFTVEEGELVTLLGPSGCGKTTLLRMIAGFEDPTSGDILFGSVRVNDTPPNLRGATMVFQSYAIFPHLSVRENVAFGLRLQKLPPPEIDARIAKVTALVELSGLDDRRPSQLSGGQQQRVALARALIMEPQLLLFDEPLSNLDAKLREQMRIDIRKLQQRLGITSIYVTHDQTEAMSISDNVIVMNAGRLEQMGPPAELYSRPVNRFVASFIGKANFLPDPESGHTIMVRPEAVKLALSGEQTDGFWGRVTRSTYLGGILEYEVETKDAALLVHEQNSFERPPFAVGDAVSIKLLPSGLVKMD